MICHLSLTYSASRYCFLCHFIAGIILIVLLSLFHCCFPSFPLAVSTNSTNFKEMKATSVVSSSRAVPPAWLSDTPVPNGILFTFLCTSLSSYHLHFRSDLLMGESLPKPRRHKQLYNFLFSFFFFLILKG